MLSNRLFNIFVLEMPDKENSKKRPFSEESQKNSNGNFPKSKFITLFGHTIEIRPKIIVLDLDSRTVAEKEVPNTNSIDSEQMVNDENLSPYEVCESDEEDKNEDTIDDLPNKKRKKYNAFRREKINCEKCDKLISRSGILNI